MTFSHALATNNYGPIKFIVATSAANGTHTTLASALAAASVGDTVYLRDSVTENVTLPAGINISSLATSTANIPSITGTVTMTAAGTSSIFGIRLVTNSAAAIAVTGSAASILNINNCYLDFTNNTGITFSSSNSSANINIGASFANLGTTGIGLYTHTSAGSLIFRYSSMFNTGGSSTASSNSAGNVIFSYCGLAAPISTSSTGAVTFTNTNVNTSAQNATCLTTAGTGTAFVEDSDFVSGSASAISVGAGTSVLVQNACRIDSTNTNAITGAGTINYGLLTFTNTSNLINTTTQVDYVGRVGSLLSGIQPAFLATHSVAQDNVTGNATVVTVNFTTEVFDQGADYDGTNTFTAPYTGRYQFNASCTITGAATATDASIFINTSNRAYVGTTTTPFPLVALNSFQLHVSCLADMEVGDTAIVQVVANGMAGATADLPAAVSNTWFSGFLVC